MDQLKVLYRWNMCLKGKNKKTLIQLIKKSLEKMSDAEKKHISVDMTPLDMI